MASGGVQARAVVESAAPELTVIIVSWNCAELLRACLNSVFDCGGELDVEIIVVDNASTDHTCSMLRQEFPNVRLVENAENLGFGRANNQAMALAGAPFFCLLNPDTILTEANTLDRVLARMREYPDIGAAGCRLVYPDGRHQVGDAGGTPTLSSVFNHAFYLSRFRSRCFRGLFLQDRGISPPYGEVTWVCGACMIVRREVFEASGGFDERYFMYGEDVEWGNRLSSAGTTVAYFPDINVVHLQGGTQLGKCLPSTRWLDGVARLYFEHNRGRHWLAFRVVFALGFLSRALVYFLMRSGGRHREMLCYARHIWAVARPGGSAAR